MSNDLALSHLFCDSHPSDAASILVRLPPEYVSGFLSSLSPAQAINLIRHMPTAYATQLLSYVDDDYSARLLAEADLSTATRLLRPLAAPRREQLTARMDAAQTAQLTRILNYPSGTVGNLVEIPALTALADWTVKHALQELKKIRRLSLFDFPVVDDEHHFLGTVTVHALLAAQDNRRLDTLCEAKELALNAYASTASVSNLPAWVKNLSLPVVDNAGILLGLLHHAVLSNLTPGSPVARGQDALAPIMAIAELYWAASSSVIATIGKKTSQRKTS